MRWSAHGTCSPLRLHRSQTHKSGTVVLDAEQNRRSQPQRGCIRAIRHPSDQRICQCRIFSRSIPFTRLLRFVGIRRCCPLNVGFMASSSALRRASHPSVAALAAMACHSSTSAQPARTSPRTALSAVAWAGIILMRINTYQPFVRRSHPCSRISSGQALRGRSGVELNSIPLLTARRGSVPGWMQTSSPAGSRILDPATSKPNL